MAAKCLASLHLCRVRATRLDALGNPVAGPKNGYCSDKPMQVQVTPEIEAGSDSTLKSGCDIIIATRKGDDLLKRFTLQIDLGVVEPGLLEMMTGGTVKTDTGDPIGLEWPSPKTLPPNIAFEGWADAWNDDHPDSDLPYWHWTWPSVHWQIGQHTLQNDFLQPQLNGSTRGNPNWGLGIWGDLDTPAGAYGEFVLTDTIPDAVCGYIDQAIT